MIGAVDRLLVVLDHDHGVAQVAQALQRVEQPAVVALVQADGGLVQHVHHAGEPRADLGGEPYPLRLAAGERIGRAVERQVVQAHVHQELQPRHDLVDDPLGDRLFVARQDEFAEEREAFLERQAAQLVDRPLVAPAADLDVTRLGPEARAVARRAGLDVQILRELLAHHDRVGFLVAPLEVRNDALEGVLADEGAAALVEVGERDALLAAVEHDALHVLGQPLERSLDLELVVRREAGEHLEIELVAAVPALDRAACQREVRKRRHAPGIEKADRAQAVAVRACAHGIVEGKQSRLELGQGVAAGRAGELRREQVLLTAVGFDGKCASVGVPQRGLERFGQALLGVGPDLEPVDHHVHRVLAVLGELGQRVDLVHPGVDAHAHEPLCAQLGKKLRVLALPVGDDGRQDHELGVLGQRHHRIDHLRHRLRLQGQLVLGAVGRAHPRVEQAQVVVDLGHRAHGRARVVAGRLLLDGDRRRQALDQVHVGLFHELQELAGVGRQRFYIAALSFGVKRVERERTLARS